MKRTSSSILLSCLLSMLVQHVADAQQPPAPTAKDIILRQAHFFDGVNSLEYTEELGSVDSGRYQKIVWKELGKDNAFSYTNTDKEQHQNTEIVVSYDGQHGFEYHPADDLMYVQKHPFERDGDYLGSLSGPLYPFEFMSTKVKRIDLNALKSAEFLRSVAERAVLVPAENRTWGGHPCIVVRVSDGYVKRLNQNVNYLVYFATDLNLYPIAWRVFSKEDENVLISYWVKHLQMIPLPGTTASFPCPDKTVYRYEKILRQIDYHYPLGKTPEDVSFSFDGTMGFSGLQVNRLTQDDFTLKPPLGTEVDDLDPQASVTSPRPN